MSIHPCKILLIEDEPSKAQLLQGLLSETENNSLAQGITFTITVSECLQDAIETLKTGFFNIILLDLNVPDSQGLDTLVKIREYAPKIAIIVQMESNDESLTVKAFQLGADGYLQLDNLDTNLLIYQMRLALEKQQYITQKEAQQQQQNEREFQVLENLINATNTSITARMFGSQPLRESVPDIFKEMLKTYGELLDLALEQRAYRIDHNISDRLRSLADKLGFLKASPRDVIDIHTATLKEKNQNVTLAKAQAHVSEGRLMVLELMGYLASFYRKYYIGLSNVNLTANPNHSKLL